MLDCFLKMQPEVDLHLPVLDVRTVWCAAAAVAVGSIRQIHPCLVLFFPDLLESFHRHDLMGIISSPPTEPTVPCSNIDFAHARFNSLCPTGVRRGGTTEVAELNDSAAARLHPSISSSFKPAEKSTLTALR